VPEPPVHGLTRLIGTIWEGGMIDSRDLKAPSKSAFSIKRSSDPVEAIRCFTAAAEFLGEIRVG